MNADKGKKEVEDQDVNADHSNTETTEKEQIEKEKGFKEGLANNSDTKSEESKKN